MKKILFILIGEAKDCFDEKLNCIKRVNFKFLLLEEDGILRMMIMVKGKPYKLHAQGLLSYMEQNSLSEIMVRGGGYILFSSSMDYSEISQFSYAFASVEEEVIFNFLIGVWPAMKISTKGIVKITDNDKTYYRIYTCGEVYTLANEPA